MFRVSTIFRVFITLNVAIHIFIYFYIYILHLYISYILYILFNIQSQCDCRSSSPPVGTDHTVWHNFPERPGKINTNIFSIWIYRFTRDEIKRLYRGFKTECPTGILRYEKPFLLLQSYSALLWIFYMP